MQSSAELQEILRNLSKLLDRDLMSVVDKATADPTEHRMTIPEADSMDFNIQEIASLVARTSNQYGQIAYQLGRARARLKIAEGKYKRKLKSSLGPGKNLAEREAAAMAAAADEYIELNIAEAAVELASAQEAWARIASESARKLLDKSATMDMASRRESAGSYNNKDFY